MIEGMFQRGEDQASTLRSGNRYQRRTGPVSPDPAHEFRVSECIKSHPDHNSAEDLSKWLAVDNCGSTTVVAILRSRKYTNILLSITIIRIRMMIPMMIRTYLTIPLPSI